MKKFRKMIAVLALVPVLITACGKEAGGGITPTEAVKPTETATAETTPTPTPSYVGEGKTVNLMEKVDVKKQENNIPVSDAFIASQHNFAAELLKTQYRSGKNTLISPYSAVAALTMTANGSKGKTLEEMENVLGQGIGIDEFDLLLTSYTKSLGSGEKFKLHTANSIWFTDNELIFKVREDFLKKNASLFDSEIYKAPFNKETLKDVNGWVNKHTDGMIPTILEDLDPDDVMLLINALAFDAEWAEIYKESDISTGEFLNAAGKAEETEMMKSSESVLLSDDNTIGFIKYYANRYAFAALLPAEGTDIDAYVASLTGEKLSNLLKNRKSAAIVSKIPKFKMECEYLFNDGLANMGMPTAFTSNADFTGMEEDGGNGALCIGKVIQKTFISVDEKGTKAGAATVVEMRKNTAIMPAGYMIDLDRPFVYMIIDTEYDLPLFIGVECSTATEKY